jgi:hypothetical protein
VSGPRVTRLSPGESGLEDEEGGVIAAPRPKKPSSGRPADFAKTGKERSADLGKRAKMSQAMRESWARRRKQKGGAARARRAEPSPASTRIATTAAPSLAPSPDRRLRLEAALEELRKERDALTLIIDHLERLLG